MATISANALGVYQTATGQTSPIEIISAASLEAVTGSTITALGMVAGDYAIVVLASSGEWVGLGKVNVAGDGLDDAIGDIELMGLATSTSLETSNTVNETVARNGSDGSTTFIVGGAMSWSMSIDGLLDLTPNGGGTATGVMDASRSKEYVLVKFDTGSNAHYIGQALIESVSISGGVDDIATYSASFNGYGDLYKYIAS
jgi:hypothetical protein